MGPQSFFNENCDLLWSKKDNMKAKTMNQNSVAVDQIAEQLVETHCKKRPFRLLCDTLFSKSIN